MTAVTPDVAALDQLSVTTIRTLAMDAVQAATSGHPGTPMGRASTACRLVRDGHEAGSAETLPSAMRARFGGLAEKVAS
jgi:hypothetical protein